MVDPMFQEPYVAPGMLTIVLETYTVMLFIILNSNDFLRTFSGYNFLVLSLVIPESVTVIILMFLPKPDVVEEMIVLSIQEIGLDVITMLEVHVFNLMDIQETLSSEGMKFMYQKEINLAVGDIKIWEHYLDQENVLR